MRHPALVGAALNLVSAPAACEGLALEGVPMFGMWGAPAQAHLFSTLRTTRSIICAEGAHQFVLLCGHKEPPRQFGSKGQR
jgi:hypothetical protein